MCHKHHFVYWTYERWRGRSTVSMVGASLIHLFLSGVKAKDEDWNHPDSRLLFLVLAHLLVAVIILCSAVTAQTLLFFRKSSANPAHIGTALTSLWFSFASIFLVAAASNSHGADIEAAYMLCVFLHLYGMAITTVNRYLVISLQTAAALLALLLVNDVSYKHGLRIVSCLCCALVVATLQHSLLYNTYIAEYGLERDIEVLEQEVEGQENLLGALFPISLHRILPKLAKDVPDNVLQKPGSQKSDFHMPAAKLASISVLAAEILVKQEDGTFCVPGMADFDILHELFGQFDIAAHEIESEKLKTEFNMYFAMAGAPVAYLGSHTTAMLVLGITIITIAQKHNKNHCYPQISVRVGVGSGAATGALLGGITQVQYHVLGEAVDHASALRDQAELGAIYVDDHTYRLLNMGHLIDNYKFSSKAVNSDVHSFSPDPVPTVVLEGVAEASNDLQPQQPDACIIQSHIEGTFASNHMSESTTTNIASSLVEPDLSTSLHSGNLEDTRGAAGADISSPTKPESKSPHSTTHETH